MPPAVLFEPTTALILEQFVVFLGVGSLTALSGLDYKPEP